MAKVNLPLTNANFKWIAKQIHKDCEPEMVIAFSRVECKREPFDTDGFPAILYERHVVYRNIEPLSKAKELARLYPSLIYKNGYGKGGYGSYSAQRGKLAKALKLVGSVAYEGCSFGAFQELGENYEDYGFDTVDEFVESMKNGMFGQCDIFIRSIRHRNLVIPMVNRQYATLALRYSGAGYRTFSYDKQIESEYKLAKAKGINWNQIEAKAPDKANTSIKLQKFLPEVDLDEHIEPDNPHEGNGTEIDTDESNGENTNDNNIFEQGELPNTSLEINKDGLKLQTNEPTDKPQEKIAVVKKKPFNFLENFWKKVTGFIMANIGLDGLTDRLQQVQALGFTAQFWKTIIYFTVAGGLIYLAYLLFKQWQANHSEKQQRTDLINANSTSTNKVDLIDEDKIADYEKRGYKIVTRG